MMVPEKGSHARAAQTAHRTRDSAVEARRLPVGAIQDLPVHGKLVLIKPEQVRPALPMGNLPRAGEIPAVGRRQEQAPVQARPERVKPVQVKPEQAGRALAMGSPARAVKIPAVGRRQAQVPARERIALASIREPAKPSTMRIAPAEALTARQLQRLDRLNV